MDGNRNCNRSLFIEIRQSGFDEKDIRRICPFICCIFTAQKKKNVLAQEIWLCIRIFRGGFFWGLCIRRLNICSLYQQQAEEGRQHKGNPNRNSGYKQFSQGATSRL